MTPQVPLYCKGRVVSAKIAEFARVLPDLRIVEVRGLPCLEIETWGTHIFNSSDLVHPPLK
jgi:hypothetical protein